MRSSLLLALLALAACDSSVCTRMSDCRKPLICGADDTCVLPPDLAELPDGGTDLAEHAEDLSSAVDLGEDLLELSDASHD